MAFMKFYNFHMQVLYIFVILVFSYCESFFIII